MIFIIINRQEGENFISRDGAESFSYAAIVKTTNGTKTAVTYPLCYVNMIYV